MLFTMALASTGCHDIDEHADNPAGNFDALWSEIDNHYCFLEEKGLDWNAIGNKYRAKLSEPMSSERLFGLMSDMLDELKDGHVNLSSPFATSYYRKWWSDYPQNFNLRVIQENYLYFKYRQLGAFTYAFLPQNIGYIYYSTFSSGFGAGNLDYILAYFTPANALIIDVRNNGGGELSNVENIVNRFIDQKILAGYIMHKTGPGHNDFSKPYAYYIEPIADGHFAWKKPVVVLCNRSTFSAANNFVSIMKSIPGVTVIGATTGGGSGMPYSSQLPNGWGIRFSACPILDAEGNATEEGVDPTPGCEVNNTAEDEANGKDAIIDFAIAYINNVLIAGKQ